MIDSVRIPPILSRFSVAVVTGATHHALRMRAFRLDNVRAFLQGFYLASYLGRVDEI